MRRQRLGPVALALVAAAGLLLYERSGGAIVHAAQRALLPLPLLLGVALAGGVASFFSPCSLVFAPTFLMAGGSAEDSRGTLLGRALWVAAGILVFYAALGLAVAWAGSAVYPIMAYLIPLLGVAFLAAGALILTGRAGFMDRLSRLNPALSAYERASAKASPLFSLGLLYGAGAHGCSLPIFLGILLVPLAAGEPARAAATVLAYGAALAASLMATVALGREVMPSRGRLWGDTAQAAAGWLFAAVGGYEVLYFVLHAHALLS